MVRILHCGQILNNSKNRKTTNLVHKSNGETLKVSKEKESGKLFILGTNTEISKMQVTSPNKGSKESNYDFSKPSQAQDLGSEWDDYAWSGDDY